MQIKIFFKKRFHRLHHSIMRECLMSSLNYINNLLTLGMEPFSTLSWLRTTRTERGWNDWKKNERERNDLAEGSRFRTERNDFKKVGTCPTLISGCMCTSFETRVKLQMQKLQIKTYLAYFLNCTLQFFI